MRIAVVGGGPGGLYFAALVKQLGGAGHEVTVWERNAPDDTFGFGVVFSDETLGGIEHADPAVFAAMQREFARWDDIDVHYGGRTLTSGGHAFAALGRRKLLEILQTRCAETGVDVHFRTEAPDIARLTAEYDLVVAADGANSVVRGRYATDFGAEVERRHCKYIWLSTDLVFEAFQFVVAETAYGAMQIHGYPYSSDESTFIVEMHEDVWRRAGFAEFTDLDLLPGTSDERSIARIKELFSDLLDGHEVRANNSKWLTFGTVRCDTWRKGNLVLLGDAAHTAHFSIGSGTKLALEDALALAACLHEQPDLYTALSAYEAERRPVVASTQRAAQASLEWFEHIGGYTHQDPEQFAFNLLTRSRRVTHENLRLRDPEFVARTDGWFASHVDGGDGARRPPMFQPFKLGGLTLANRVVVSPMDMYSARDGVPGEFHLVHLGGKALGGAGLVMTEMVCVSAEGRITPGCAGLYSAEQEAAWTRVVDFVHGQSSARIGVQIGHSGRKGSTKLMWDGIDEPLPTPADNWPLFAPSPLPYSQDNQVPHELARAQMDEVKEQFVASARAAARAGFDLLELHCAHGYLLSSFISPLTNQRTDEYGGSLDRRLRYPLEVFDAVRAVWPAERPMTVRISATDWHEGGIDADDAVEIARAFALHGAAGLDVSTGQVVKDERPAYGRSYQTPYADRIRNEVGRVYGVAVIAVGAISSADDVNSILLAGRADLCALGRTHLYDPQWTLHAAAAQGYAPTTAAWPLPYAAGSRPPADGRKDDPRPRLDLIRRGTPATRHARWKPGPESRREQEDHQDRQSERRSDRQSDQLSDRQSERQGQNV
jgi:anthraniloyl-CoA monooxygenase